MQRAATVDQKDALGQPNLLDDIVISSAGRHGRLGGTRVIARAARGALTSPIPFLVAIVDVAQPEPLHAAPT